MSSEELYIRIWMVQERNDQTPGLWSLLELEKLMLETFQVIMRCRRRWRRVGFLDQLQGGDNM